MSVFCECKKRTSFVFTFRLVFRLLCDGNNKFVIADRLLISLQNSPVKLTGQDCSQFFSG